MGRDSGCLGSSPCPGPNCVNLNKALPPPEFTPLASAMGRWSGLGTQVPFQPRHSVPMLFIEAQKEGRSGLCDSMER